MVVGSWYVQLADAWRWFLPLCIYMTVKIDVFTVIVHSSYSFYVLYDITVSINYTEWVTIPACPSLICFTNEGSIEGTNSWKICVWCLCMFCFVFV